MSGSFLNTVVSAIVGALAAVGTGWYLSAHSDGTNSADPEGGAAVRKIKNLEVDSLVVRNSLRLVSPDTNESLVEIRDGKVFVQKGVYAEHMGAWRMTAQKLQTTPEDPIDPDSAVFGELAINEDGGGYLAILSPQETHSLTIGFDQTERGGVVSQNNEERTTVAQAVFLKPTGVAANLTNATATRPSAISNADVNTGSFFR
ncbi:MAG: hypothetical protein ACOX0A_01510 [Thermoguttaceae bacterium]|jgi:hypothetical protein